MNLYWFDIKIDFIGKDTTRNNKNISTQKYIESIVNKKYKDNINFLGHIPNFELNEYLNRALVGVYPSLFDNFPLSNAYSVNLDWIMKKIKELKKVLRHIKQETLKNLVN